MFLLLLLLQISGASVGEVIIVADMHQRKAQMAKNADAFIALPGLIYFYVYNSIFIHIFYQEIKLKSHLILFRWLWNHGGTARDYSLVSVGNS